MTNNNEKVSLASISLSSGKDKSQNIKQAINAINEACDMGAEWVLLPEVFTYAGSYDRLFSIADDPRGEVYEKLASLSQKRKICLFAGSYAEKPTQSEQAHISPKVLNVSYVFGRNGEEIARYEKTHLFQLIENGRKKYSEPDGYLYGKELKSIAIEGWQVGLSICYDLRFPELYVKLAREKPLDLITVPAAFTLETGKDHWEVLLRARAIEHQCYVFAANQFGSKAGQNRLYGHSMIIDPWGIKVADTGDQYGIAIATAHKKRIMEVREKVPALSDKRYDLYQ